MPGAHRIWCQATDDMVIVSHVIPYGVHRMLLPRIVGGRVCKARCGGKMGALNRPISLSVVEGEGWCFVTGFYMLMSAGVLGTCRPPNEGLIKDFKARLKIEYGIKELGILSHTLRLEVQWMTNGSVCLSQKKYAQTVLADFWNFFLENPMSLWTKPMDQSCPLQWNRPRAQEKPSWQTYRTHSNWGR